MKIQRKESIAIFPLPVHGKGCPQSFPSPTHGKVELKKEFTSGSRPKVFFWTRSGPDGVRSFLNLSSGALERCLGRAMCSKSVAIYSSTQLWAVVAQLPRFPQKPWEITKIHDFSLDFPWKINYKSWISMISHGFYAWLGSGAAPTPKVMREPSAIG